MRALFGRQCARKLARSLVRPMRYFVRALPGTDGRTEQTVRGRFTTGGALVVAGSIAPAAPAPIVKSGKSGGLGERGAGELAGRRGTRGEDGEGWEEPRVGCSVVAPSVVSLVDRAVSQREASERLARRRAARRADRPTNAQTDGSWTGCCCQLPGLPAHPDALLADRRQRRRSRLWSSLASARTVLLCD